MDYRIIIIIIIVAALLIFSMAIQMFLPSDLLQFFEELPYYIIIIAIFGLSIYTLCIANIDSSAVGANVSKEDREEIKFDDRGNIDFEGVNNETEGKHRVVIKKEHKNIAVFYIFIYNLYMIILCSFEYLFQGILWLIYFILQNDDKVAIQGNINKDIFHNKIKIHAIAIYNIIYIYIFNILNILQIKLPFNTPPPGTV